MNTKEEIMSNIVQPLSASAGALSRANCHLTFALAKHLIEKGIIDLDEYLESHRATEEFLKKEILLTDVGDDKELAEMHVDYIEMMFESHRSELKKL
ncbi:hypothetical protein [Psychrobacter alimentarius]|uniref:hypothetical protein n=1 Tax=Psychrobacter alimentarius TaxID=261164 RepID=UPI003FD6B6EE